MTVSGSYSNMGRALGRKFRRMAASMVSDARRREDRKGTAWAKAVEKSSGFLPFAEDYFPDYVRFVEGYSDGSGIPFDDLFVLLVEDEKGMCTDLAVNQTVTADGTVFQAHTEDWRESDEERTCVVRFRPRDAPSALVATVGGLEWICGLNSSGIGLTANSLYPDDERTGIPKLAVAPKVLTSRTTSDALSSAMPDGRASSFNNNICHSSGELYCIEGSATDFGVIYGFDGYNVHTNHYVHPRMICHEALYGPPGDRHIPHGSSSLLRYNRATRLLLQQLGNVDVGTIKEILSDHVNYPSSICAHPENEKGVEDRYKTDFAVIMDLTRSKMMLCVGNPCKGEFTEHEL